MARRSYRIAVIPGDGIGREVTPAAMRVLAEGRIRTPDLGGGHDTAQMTEAVVEKI
jgi:isocitrate/isopropylmalate dehydrogenase